MISLHPAKDGNRRLPRSLGYACLVSALVFLGSSVNYTSASTPVEAKAALTSMGQLDSGLVGYRLQLTPSGGDLTDPVVRVELPPGHRIYTEQSVPQQYVGRAIAPVLPAQCQAPSRVVPERANRPAELVCYLNAVPAGTSLALKLTAAAIGESAMLGTARAIVAGGSFETVTASSAPAP